nr:MAG TPA: hypothetical protein [Caudoviricetes sp.]
MEARSCYSLESADTLRDSALASREVFHRWFNHWDNVSLCSTDNSASLCSAMMIWFTPVHRTTRSATAGKTDRLIVRSTGCH